MNMSITKANRLISEAKANGWEVKWTLHNRENENVQVECTRGAEYLEIEWNNFQLARSASYRYHEMTLVVNNASAAKRILQRIKPDIEQYQRWQRRNRKQIVIDETREEAEQDFSDYILPFDIHKDDDSTILKAIRGNTILFKNSLTGNVESVMVPWKISGGKTGIRVMNRDLDNVFYLAEGAKKRDYLSFMDSEGRFRAVHLDRLIGVV